VAEWGEEVVQVMYTHVSKCKNDKIKCEKKIFQKKNNDIIA
jgi:hypothetical protein